MTQSKSEEKSWRDYEPPGDIRGSWCPLMSCHCLGAQCALWIPKFKRCAILHVAIHLTLIEEALERR